MLRIRTELIDAVHRASEVSDLWHLVQSAIELEHATIPPYLTAMFSLKSGGNSAAYQIIASVVREEMLHMTIAANLLNAIGGNPEIDRPGFIPNYPGPLPMMADDGLIVGLRKATRDLIINTFMRIEEPEDPIRMKVKNNFAVMGVVASPVTETDTTIGDFYRAIKKKLTDIGKPAFANSSHPQVVGGGWFPPSQLFEITDVDSACHAIDIIIDQGEGTATDPIELGTNDKPAHYYRFAQILNARMLVTDPNEMVKYSYSGAEVALNPEYVWNLYPDPKAADYAPGSRARYLVDRFNYSYTALLHGLHQAFNGEPNKIDAALGLMYEMRLLGADVVSAQVGDTGLRATPSFEYTPVLR